MKRGGGMFDRLLIAALLLLVGFAPAGCARPGDNSTSGRALSGDVLKVGITPNAPPLIYTRDGEPTGLEAELAREFAAYTGRTIRFVEVQWVDQIPALISGKTDIIMSGMTITDLRRMRINFTVPYLITGQALLVRRSDYSRFSRGLTDLLSPVVKIGTVKGTTGDFLVQQKAGRSNVRQFDAPRQAVKAVIDGGIDAFVYDLPMNFYFAALNEAEGVMTVPVPLSRELIAWGVRREDAELLNAANRFIEEMQEDNRLQAAVLRWIPFYQSIYDEEPRQ